MRPMTWPFDCHAPIAVREGAMALKFENVKRWFCSEDALTLASQSCWRELERATQEPGVWPAEQPRVGSLALESPVPSVFFCRLHGL